MEVPICRRARHDGADGVLDLVGVHRVGWDTGDQGGVVPGHSILDLHVEPGCWGAGYQQRRRYDAQPWEVEKVTR